MKATNFKLNTSTYFFFFSILLHFFFFSHFFFLWQSLHTECVFSVSEIADSTTIHRVSFNTKYAALETQISVRIQCTQKYKINRFLVHNRIIYYPLFVFIHLYEEVMIHMRRTLCLFAFNSMWFCFVVLLFSSFY